MRAFFILFGLTVVGTASSQLEPADFLDGTVREFAQRTDYRLIPPDEADAAHSAVHATCRDATASALIVEREVDITKTPFLEWRWRVDTIFQGIDETEKPGDDYPARVYVIAERWPRFRSRVINYVWSSSQPMGATWESAYASQFQMVAVRSGSADLGRWVTDRRDVREDFRRLHGIEINSVDAVAIMTDCDNAGQQASAWYGPVRWLPQTKSAETAE